MRPNLNGWESIGITMNEYLSKHMAYNIEHYLRKGVKVTRFRKTNKQVRNRILYAILLSKNIKFSELADLIGVSSRSINYWVIDGVIPSLKRRRQVCSVLGYPDHVLFNNEIKYSHPIICIPHASKYHKGVTARSKVKNEILHGLLILYNISTTDYAHWIDLHPGTVRKYLHTPNFIPSIESQRKTADFFKIAPQILYTKPD